MKRLSIAFLALLILPSLLFAAAGDVPVSIQNTFAGEDVLLDVQKVEQRFLLTNIATATTTVVKNGPGYLNCITVNTTAAGAITVYDNTAGSGTKLATLKSSIAENTYCYNGTFSIGLTIVTAAASDITVSSR